MIYRVGCDAYSFSSATTRWDRLVNLNVKSIFYMTVALLPLLEKGAQSNIDPARVINVTSMNGTNVQVGCLHYVFQSRGHL